MPRPRRTALSAALAILTLCLPLRAAAKEGSAVTADSIYNGTFHLLAAGKQSDAERVLAEGVRAFDTDARLAFFHAACTRSRFAVRDSVLLFRHVVAIDPAGPYGRAATLILQLDGSPLNTQAHFDALTAIVAEHPDDPLLTWMVAVQCRSLNKPLVGIPFYERLGKVFDAHGGPGPCLFHQTYANLLDDAERYEEALPHRLLAVQLEPASWSYDGLGNTLNSLRRWKEADAAYARSTALAPDDARKWSNWCGSLRDRGDWEGVIAKASHGLAVSDPSNGRLWRQWADAEARLGRYPNAVRCYNQVINYYPSDPAAYERAASLLDRMGEPEQALIYRARAARLRPGKPLRALAVTVDGIDTR